jgi:hypothetical protein
MWPVKNSSNSVKDNANPRSLPFRQVSSRSTQQILDASPLNIGSNRILKILVKNPLMQIKIMAAPPPNSFTPYL